MIKNHVHPHKYINIYYKDLELHKVTILSRIRNLNIKSMSTMPKVNKPQVTNLQ